MQAIATDSKAVAQELGLVLKGVMRSTNRDFFAALDAAGLSFTQVKCLGLLNDVEALSLSALAEELFISLPAASRAVDNLVQRGEVSRIEDVRDRRCKLVSITAGGRRTFEKLIAVRRAGIERLLAELAPAELEELQAGLRPLVRRMGR